MPEETFAEDELRVPAVRGIAISKMLLIVALTVVSSISGGVISFVLLNRTFGASAKAIERQDKPEQEKIAELLQKSAVLPLEPFVVNLADTESARYLRIKISLMIDDKSRLREVTENEALQLKVRDIILQSLTAKTSRDLISEQGKNNLRHEIQSKIALYFREPKVVDVMFTEFVIQL